jgi:hypothetical protein
MQIKLDPKTTDKFKAAQLACKDHVPNGLSATDQNVTPERMQKLIGFAECVRKEGVKEFPDPSSKGAFVITSPTLQVSSPQVQQALRACRESNPSGPLMIRMALPK